MVNEGTTIVIYLPACQKEFQADTAFAPETLLYGTETIMVFDDEAYVRNSVKNMLEDLGYAVITAPDGMEAVEL